MIKKLKLRDFGKIINDAFYDSLGAQYCESLDSDSYTQDDFDRFIEDNKMLEEGLTDGWADSLDELENFFFMGMFPFAFEDFPYSDGVQIQLMQMSTGHCARMYYVIESYVMQIRDKDGNVLIEKMFDDLKNEYDEVCQFLEDLISLGYEIKDIDDVMYTWLMDDVAGDIKEYELLHSAIVNKE